MQRNEVRTHVLQARSRDAAPDFFDADLRGRDLAGLDLSGANLTGADLRDADLRDTQLREACLLDADLRGADLRRANLERALLADARLQGARLQGANLTDVALSKGGLVGVDLEGVDLSGTWELHSEPDDAELASHTDEDWATSHTINEPAPAPPLTERQRQLPILAQFSPGTTLPVRLGEDVPLHRITRPMLLFTASVGGVFAVILAFALRSSLADVWPPGKGDPILAALGLLRGLVIAIVLVFGFSSGLLRPILRHLRTAREEGVTIVELSSGSVRPGATARAYVELSRHAPIEKLRVRLVCVRVKRPTRLRRSRRSVNTTIDEAILHESAGPTFPPDTPWRHHLTLTIPHDARRHNRDPFSRFWFTWQLEIGVQTTGRPLITRDFPFIVE